MSFISDVQAFHDKFGLATPASFTFLSGELLNFRVGFLHEETDEYVECFEKNDLAIAIDSLIDLIYVACGSALLNGIDPAEFNVEVTTPDTGLSYFDVGQSENYDGPAFLTKELSDKFVSIVKTSIAGYELGNVNSDQEAVRSCLFSIYKSALNAMYEMGMTEECVQEFWDDVQKCNMAKERALKVEDSKRGSTWDVYKPVGWTPPDSKGILAKWLAI